MQTQRNLRRLGPILEEIFEESRLRWQKWDRRLTQRLHRQFPGVDPGLPKVALYVGIAVVVLVIPLLTLTVLGAAIVFLAIQIGQKWPRWQQLDSFPRPGRPYLPSATAERHYSRSYSRESAADIAPETNSPLSAAEVQDSRDDKGNEAAEDQGYEDDPDYDYDDYDDDLSFG